MRVLVDGRHLKKKHIWFQEVKSVTSCVGDEKYDELIVHGNPVIITGRHTFSKEQISLLTNLDCEKNEIWILFSKTVRNEINRAIKENIKVEFFGYEELINNQAILLEFEQIYNAMYASKGMENERLGIGEVKGYINNKCLLISRALIDEKAVVYHSYVFGEHNCRLLHSCSEFRTENKELKNAIGRANKYLHWKDIDYFMNVGVKNYDWGGISSEINPNGIDVFKMAFGGVPVHYYNIEYDKSFKSRIIRHIRKFLH